MRAAARRKSSQAGALGPGQLTQQGEAGSALRGSTATLSRGRSRGGRGGVQNTSAYTHRLPHARTQGSTRVGLC
eukprot:6074401-Pyramimonas_sp.AAC.1